MFQKLVSKSYRAGCTSEQRPWANQPRVVRPSRHRWQRQRTVPFAPAASAGRDTAAESAPATEPHADRTGNGSHHQDEERSFKTTSRGPLWTRSLKFGVPGFWEDDGRGYYTDNDGNRVEVMFHDYGFRSGHGRMYQEDYGKIPKSGFSMALDNFKHEYRSLRRSFRFDEWKEYSENAPSDKPLIKAWRSFATRVVGQFAEIDTWLEGRGLLSKLEPSQTDLELNDSDAKTKRGKEMAAKLALLELSTKKLAQREKRREAAGQGVKTPFFVKLPYTILCWLLDVVYPNRPIQRFWLLEVVARMPYFSYISMLHLFETLGFWRAGADLRKIHFAEEYNELHHMQIMEALGGDELWLDRFIAQHAAFIYYWILVAFYWLNPKLAYNFSELIEAHAVDTYGEFADANEELLKSMPPPLVALQYYKADDLYLFDEFQTSKRSEPRRPPCRNLHDVFINIRDDEGEHVKTMQLHLNTSCSGGSWPPIRDRRPCDVSLACDTHRTLAVSGSFITPQPFNSAGAGFSKASLLWQSVRESINCSAISIASNCQQLYPSPQSRSGCCRTGLYESQLSDPSPHVPRVELSWWLGNCRACQNGDIYQDLKAYGLTDSVVAGREGAPAKAP